MTIMENIMRQNVLLKSGNGTVAAEDYDPQRHGPAVDESDEQYTARIAGKMAKAQPSHPPTTIANLHTFDTASIVAPVVPVLPPRGIAHPVVSQKVVAEAPPVVPDDSTKRPPFSVDDAKGIRK